MFNKTNANGERRIYFSEGELVSIYGAMLRLQGEFSECYEGCRSCANRRSVLNKVGYELRYDELDLDN